MQIEILKCKIKELIVSESSVEYPGSIALPEELLTAAGIVPFEKVYVNNKSNGNRIITYAVKSKKPGFVTVNGAASKLFEKNDFIHVMAYTFLSPEEAATFSPTLVECNEENIVVHSGKYNWE